MDVIIPTPLDVAESKFKIFKENRAMNLAKNTSLSSILTNDNDFEELKEQFEGMDSATAENLMEKYIGKGKTAEEALIYQAALKEYEKALYLASGFNFEEKIGKISFMILEVEKKINDMELEYAKEAAEKAEKRRDYITSIGNYRKAIEILEKRLTEVQVNPEETESKIRKIKKKISKLEAKI
jgi:tetratricopeptide (TPR) repeat protein